MTHDAVVALTAFVFVLGYLLADLVYTWARANEEERRR